MHLGNGKNPEGYCGLYLTLFCQGNPSVLQIEVPAAFCSRKGRFVGTPLIHACTQAHGHSRTYTCVWAHTHTHTHTRTHAHTHTHTHTLIHIHTRTHTCAHTHTQNKQAHSTCAYTHAGTCGSLVPSRGRSCFATDPGCRSGRGCPPSS